MTKSIIGEITKAGIHDLNGGFFKGAFIELDDEACVAVNAIRSTDEVRLVAAGEFDFITHLRRQAAWSEQTFGPGHRTAGVVDHIRKELTEVVKARDDAERHNADPRDVLAEWIDVVILGLDGAWRTGATPEDIVEAFRAKQARNEARKWPDWRTMPADKAIEHDRAEEASLAIKVRTCNMHDDCDAADEKMRAKNGCLASHCRNDCCEDCFGT